MKKNYYQLMTLILVMIFFIQSSQRILSQERLSAETPFIEVNGKVIKFGSAIIAFSKIQQRNSVLRGYRLNNVFSGFFLVLQGLALALLHRSLSTRRGC